MRTHASAWWLPLAAYRDMCRSMIEHERSRGVSITWREARHIYRVARNGAIYCRPGTLDVFK